MYLHVIKRIIDIIAASLSVIIFLPLFLITTLILIFINHGKPFYLQERPGRGKKIFKLIKYKTMNDCSDPNGNLLSDKQRLHKIGSIIRSVSLDELPQLFNVLRGDMSLIGPRPLLVRYLSRYNEHQARRHEVRPGITGWAQVNGRNALSWEEKFELDVYYVDNVNFKLDMKILFLTIKKVVRREGISAQNAATMPEFKGTSTKQ
jgi:lipopolysaccharide/colanic/teichoic acid biosynthesis glycosyltransferase